WIPLTLVVTVVGFLVIRGPSYVAQSHFVPQAPRENSLRGLSGLAAQLGLNLPGTESGASVEFYADFATSSGVFRELALKEYKFSTSRGGKDTLKGNIISLLHVKGSTPLAAEQKAILKLHKMVDVTPIRRSGMVRIT